jgi:glycerol-1-phosphate dehydrogenase [NAD(P)+]
VRAIADSVPEPERIEAWLRRAGGPATPEDLGLAPDLVTESLASAMYVRNRYTVLRLANTLALHV